MRTRRRASRPARLGRQGIANAEIPLAAAIAMAGHVRGGLEDNLTMPDGRPASNLLSVEKVVRTPGNARRI